MASILFVAPTESMARTAMEIAKELGIEFSIVTAGLSEVTTAIQQYPEASIFVSRGGVAQKLRQNENATVIEIKATTNDIWGSVERMTAAGINKIGLVAQRASLVDDSIRNFNPKLQLQVEHFGKMAATSGCIKVVEKCIE